MNVYSFCIAIAHRQKWPAIFDEDLVCTVQCIQSLIWQGRQTQACNTHRPRLKTNQHADYSFAQKVMWCVLTCAKFNRWHSLASTRLFLYDQNSHCRLTGLEYPGTVSPAARLLELAAPTQKQSVSHTKQALTNTQIMIKPTMDLQTGRHTLLAAKCGQDRKTCLVSGRVDVLTTLSCLTLVNHLCLICSAWRCQTWAT